LRNVVKYGKYSPVKLANFEYFSITRGKITIFEPKVVIFTRIILKNTENLLISQGYIFRILQHLATPNFVILLILVRMLF
jgi:hypothetical protein